MNRLHRLMVACVIAGTFSQAAVAHGDPLPPSPTAPTPQPIAAAELTLSGWRTESVSHVGADTVVRGYFRVANIGNVQTPPLVVVRLGISGSSSGFYSLSFTSRSTPKRVGESVARTVALPAAIKPGTSVRLDVAVTLDCFATLDVDVDASNIVWEQREFNNRSSFLLSSYCVE